MIFTALRSRNVMQNSRQKFNYYRRLIIKFNIDLALLNPKSFDFRAINVLITTIEWPHGVLFTLLRVMAGNNNTLRMGPMSIGM